MLELQTEKDRKMTMQEKRIESLRKSLESHKAELATAMFESHTKRLQDAIASIERALSKA